MRNCCRGNVFAEPLPRNGSGISAHLNDRSIIMFLDIINRLVFCLKCRPVYISKHNVSETGFCLRPQVKPTQLGSIDRDSPRTMDDVQEHNNCTNLPSSQTFRSYQRSLHSNGSTRHNILIICGLFNDTVSKSPYLTSDTFLRICKEAMFANFS
jgi:hypothetical protein